METLTAIALTVVIFYLGYSSGWNGRGKHDRKKRAEYMAPTQEKENG